MKIGIIGAMDSETAHLKEILKDAKETSIANMTFREGKIGNTDTVVVKCGIGMVNAAVCAQILIDHFNITHLINTGIAGSLNNDINIGDLVVSTDAVTHDFSVGPLGYPDGQIPGMDTLAFEADSDLRTLIADTIRKTVPEISVFEGRIASGDQFICTKDRKDWIRTTFGAECTEMEGAAIAQTAYVNGIPFVILRFISDKADESSQVEYSVFEAEAALRSAKITAAAVASLTDEED